MGKNGRVKTKTNPAEYDGRPGDLTLRPEWEKQICSQPRKDHFCGINKALYAWDQIYILKILFR